MRAGRGNLVCAYGSRRRWVRGWLSPASGRRRSSYRTGRWRRAAVNEFSYNCFVSFIVYIFGGSSALGPARPRPAALLRAPVAPVELGVDLGLGTLVIWSLCLFTLEKTSFVYWFLACVPIVKMSFCLLAAGRPWCGGWASNLVQCIVLFVFVQLQWCRLLRRWAWVSPSSLIAQCIRLGH